MITRILTTIWLGLSLTSISWSQQPTPIDKDLRGYIRSSNVVAVGRLETTISVVRPEAGAKLDRQSHTVILPDPKAYTAGRIYRIKITSILKTAIAKDRETKDYLDIFVPGIYQLHSKPVLVKGKEYVFFVERLTDETKAYANTVVFPPDGEQTPFVAKDYWSVVEQGNGVIEVKNGEDDLVQKIKTILESN